MIKHSRHSAIVAAFVATFALAGASDALAAKMTYEDAFTKCREELAGKIPANEYTASGPRYTAAAGCMKKYGYRLKKKK